MSELHLPWLQLSVIAPLVGALSLIRVRDHEQARQRSIVALGVSLFFAVCAWGDLAMMEANVAHDPWNIPARIFGGELFLVDLVSSPLLPLTALAYLVTAMATPKTKIRRFSFPWNLVSASLLLATFSCREPAAVIALMSLGTIPPFIELRDRRRPTRVYALHMGLMALLLVWGWMLTRDSVSQMGMLLLLAGVLVRSGVIPVHCWMTDLFEHATFGTALLFVTPMVGAYAAVRLVLPIAPDWAIRGIALMSLATSLYAAGMAVVQKETRRFFCYLFLSFSSLILVGIETATLVSLTGSLAVWMSGTIALAGFGLTLRSLEARIGRTSLANYHGLYEHSPALATLFLLTGLASIGFPGTFGFIGTELLMTGEVEAFPIVGVSVVLAAALNGIAIVRAYFRLFTGVRHATSIDLRVRGAERIAVLSLTLLILAGGFFPQPSITSRYEAALQIVESRERSGLSPKPEAGTPQVATQELADAVPTAK